MALFTTMPLILASVALGKVPLTLMFSHVLFVEIATEVGPAA